MSLNEVVNLRIKAFEESLKDNHGGNPVELLDLIEVNQEGLADTPYGHHEPVFQSYVYARVGTEIVGGTVLVFRDGTGVLRARTYALVGTKREQRHTLGPMMIRFWRFGCRHLYHDMTREDCAEQGIGPLGRCEHAIRCANCGHIWIYDSSD